MNPITKDDFDNLAKKLGKRKFKQLQAWSYKANILKAMMALSHEKTKHIFTDEVDPTDEAVWTKIVKLGTCSPEEIKHQIALDFQGQVPMQTISGIVQDYLPILIKDRLIKQYGTGRYFCEPQGAIIGAQHAELHELDSTINQN